MALDDPGARGEGAGVSAFRLLAASALVAGGTAAAVAALALRLAPEAPPPVARVHLEALVTAHVEAAAREGAAPEATRAFALALEAALQDVAARRRVVLLPARAVAAGAPDLTPAVRAALDAPLAEDGP